MTFFLIFTFLIVIYLSQLSFVNNISIKITYFTILNSYFRLTCDERDIVFAKCQIFVKESVIDSIVSFILSKIYD